MPRVVNVARELFAHLFAAVSLSALWSLHCLGCLAIGDGMLFLILRRVCKSMRLQCCSYVSIDLPTKRIDAIDTQLLANITH